MTTSTASVTTSVAERRRAALERLHGTTAPADRRPSRRTRPADRRTDRRPARAAAPPSPKPRAVLGPPPGTFYAIAGVVTVLMMLGLVMVLSASAVTEANLGNSPYRVFVRQAMWAVFGAIALVGCVRVDYRVWRRLVIPIGVLAVAAMIAPFAPTVGAEINGARSWILLGPFSVQPSEFLKLAVVLLTAELLVRRGDRLDDRRATLGPIAALAFVGAGLCLAQGDLGAAIVLASIVFSIAWVAGVPATPLAGLVAVSIGSALMFVVSSPRRLDRFTAFLNVTEEKDHLAYQTYQGFLSMASGGITGSGIGGSNGKLGYLPYAHSDFIFAVIADELGLIGTIAVIGGFVMLVGFGVQTALAAPDRFGMLLAGGIAAWFGVQAVINIGGVTGLMPVTGLTLPFFSAGGSSLFVSMVAAGLLLSVARRVNST
jgi:cell division protein FtsW